MVRAIGGLFMESESLRVGGSLIIIIGILIELFGAGAMLGVLGATVKSASSLILFWGMFVFLVGVTVHIFSRLPSSIRSFKRTV